MNPGMVKICGVRDRADLAVLGAAGADLAGVWCGVPGGRADLPVAAARELLSPVKGTEPQPVLVTLASGPDLLGLVAATGARWVQLHGRQPPAAVRALTALGVVVVTVLHLRDGRCAQEALLPAYERAGTDYFLLDTATGDGRLGSTGVAQQAGPVERLAARLTRPFLLAGGITARNRPDYDAVAGHAGFAGVDVDSAARDAGGAITGPRVTELVEAWT